MKALGIDVSKWKIVVINMCSLGEVMASPIKGTHTDTIEHRPHQSDLRL